MAFDFEFVGEVKEVHGEYDPRRDLATMRVVVIGGTAKGLFGEAEFRITIPREKSHEFFVELSAGTAMPGAVRFRLSKTEPAAK
jgi:hypothetical protein